MDSEEVAMGSLFLSFGIVLLAMAPMVAFLSWVDVAPESALAVATSLVGTVPYVHRWILRRKAVRRHGPMARLVSLDGFGIPARRMTIYALCLMTAIAQAASGFGGLSAGMAGVEIAQSFHLFGIFVLVVTLPGMFLVGRWVGRRCAERGLLVVVVAASATRVLASLIDFMFLRSETAAMLGGDPSAVWFMQQAAAGSVLFVAFALLGYWRGRRQRLASYVAHLLRQIPEDSRSIIIDLVFEEARRHAHGFAPRPPSLAKAV